MKEVLNAVEAARVIGCRHQEVRYNLQKGIWKFGKVIYPSGKKTRNRYIINTREMCHYFQIPLEEAEGRVSKNGDQTDRYNAASLHASAGCTCKKEEKETV